MTWRSEIALIMRKDAREQRWMIGGYLIILLFGIVNALGWLGTRYSFEGGMLLVVGAGMLLLASLVQADSPTRPDAFWTTHPHRPLAVMLAKLVLATVVIIMPALVGQYAALSALEVTGGAAARSLAAAAFIYATWLLLTLVISAITPDLRTFILVMIATPITLTVAANLLLSKGPSLSTSARTAVGAAAFLVAVNIVAALYRTRDVKWRTWIVAVLVVVCTAYTVIAASPTTTVAANRVSAAPSSALHLDLGAVAHTASGNAILDLRVVVDSAADERVHFTPEQAEVDFVDGTTATLSIHYGDMLMTAPAVAMGGGITLAPVPQAPGRAYSIAIQLPAGHSLLSTRDVSSVTLDGNIVSEAATVVGSMPMERRATVVQPGFRADLDEVRPPPEAKVELHVRAIANDAAPLQYGLYGSSVLDAVLVDEAHRTAQLLFPLGSNGASGAMVLPASDVHNEVMRFGVAPPGIATPVPTPAGFSPSLSGVQSASASASPGSTWTQTHRLTLVRWVSRSNYHVRFIAHPAPATEPAPPTVTRAR